MDEWANLFPPPINITWMAVCELLWGDKVIKWKPDAGVEEWFLFPVRSLSSVVWGIWLCTIHGGEKGNESNRERGETQRG